MLEYAAPTLSCWTPVDKKLFPASSGLQSHRRALSSPVDSQAEVRIGISRNLEAHLMRSGSCKKSATDQPTRAFDVLLAPIPPLQRPFNGILSSSHQNLLLVRNILVNLWNERAEQMSCATIARSSNVNHENLFESYQPLAACRATNRTRVLQATARFVIVEPTVQSISVAQLTPFGLR